LTINELSKSKRILIIRLSSLGDILLSTPLIRAIKSRFPQIEIDFVLREQYTDTLKLNPHLNKIFLYKKNNVLNKNIFDEIAANNYDLIIDLQNNLRSRKITSIAKSKVVRFDKRTFDKFLLVNFKINKLNNAPQIPVRYAQTIDDLNLDNKGIDLFTDKTANQLIIGKENLIGLCPGARHFTKRYPKEYFIQLANQLYQHGHEVVLFGGKIDKQLCNEIKNEIPFVIDLSNDDDLLQTATDMKICSTIVCNDSGLMHVASSTGTFVVALFGSTIKEFGFTPYNCNHSIFENNLLTCRPCSHIGRSSCPKKHFNCLLAIKPEAIFENILSSIIN